MNSITIQVLNIIKSDPFGVTNDILEVNLRGISTNDKVNAINELVRTGQIVLHKQNNILKYKFKEPIDCKISSKLKTVEEKIIYEIVTKAGNQGIWSQEIRKEANLTEKQSNKILKNLEANKLIKFVKSVNAGRKKFYMLYDIVPDDSITGGIWYHDQEFETELVEVLNKQCYRFLLTKRKSVNNNNNIISPETLLKNGCASTAEVHKYISDLKLCLINLNIEHIETILYTLVLDGHAEQIADSDGKWLYRAVNQNSDNFGLTNTPCGLCPIFDKCHINSEVNPKQCIYLTQWLLNDK